MGGELVIDVEPGEVHWFANHGPKRVVGPCPHDCDHRSLSDIAWGSDFEHYTLDECRDCGCRSWLPVMRNPRNPTKPKVLYGRARWMQVAAYDSEEGGG